MGRALPLHALLYTILLYYCATARTLLLHVGLDDVEHLARLTEEQRAVAAPLPRAQHLV